MREWLYLAEPARALRLWYKRPPYCLTSSVNTHTHTHEHPFSACCKLATRWHVNEWGFVKYFWACNFDFFHPKCIFVIIFSFTHRAYVKAYLLRSPRVQSDSKRGGLMGEHYFWKIWIFMRINGKLLCLFFPSLLIFCHILMLQWWMLVLSSAKVSDNEVNICTSNSCEPETQASHAPHVQFHPDVFYSWLRVMSEKNSCVCQLIRRKPA